MFPCVAISLRRSAAIPTMHPASLFSSDSRGPAFGSRSCPGTATRSTGQIGWLHGVVRVNVHLLGSRLVSGLFGEWPSQLLGFSPGFAATDATWATWPKTNGFHASSPVTQPLLPPHAAGVSCSDTVPSPVSLGLAGSVSAVALVVRAGDTGR